jgi:uncharacterized protein with beta-barrel porin domain
MICNDTGMISPFSRFCLTTTALYALWLPMAAQAGSGTITYDTEYVSQFGSVFLGNPEQVAVGPDNNIYVANNFSGDVIVFDKSGNFVTQVGTPGTGPGQFDRVSGVSFTNDGKLVIGDESGRIQLLDASTYNYISEIHAPSSYYLNTDSAGNIYIAEQNAGQIGIYDSNGNSLGNFFTVGNPNTVAVDLANNRTYVVDTNSSAVSIYDASHTFIGYLAQAGSNPGEVNLPNGVSVDDKGNVYITDYGNSRVNVYDKTGAFLTSYDNNGSPQGTFLGAEGIYADTDGRIYVGEYSGNIIDILQLTSTETFSSSPVGGDETATTPLSNLVLTGTGTFANNFIGYNNLVVSGNWTLGGTSSFVNGVGWDVGGTLTNNGTLTTQVFSIGNGSTIAGMGTYIGIVSNNGTISPGDNGGASIGTLTINGAYYQDSNSATYLVNANATGQSDKIVVLNGNAQLGGSSVQINAASGTYHVATSYVILSAAGGVTGTFGSVTDNLAFLDPTLDYSNPDEVILTLTRNDGINPFPTGVDFTPYAANGNSAAIANALSSYSTSQFNGDTSTFNIVQGLSIADAGKLLNEVSPDTVAALPQMQVGMIHNMQAPMFDRLQSAPSSDSQQSFGFVSPASSPSGITPDQAWIQTIGGVDNQDSSSNGAAGYRLGTVGVRAGADKDINSKQKLGLSFAYAHGTANYKDSDDSSQTQYVHADVYGRQLLQQNFVLEGFAGVGGGRMDSTRYITAGGLNNEIIGNTNAYDVSGAVKLSKPIRMNNNGDIITPNITGSASWTRQNGFTETGASAFNLHMDSITATPITITPMVNWQHTIKNEKYGYNLTPDLGVGATWQLTDLSDNVNANFSNATNAPGFTVTGAKQAPISLNFSAAITMQPFTSNKYIPTLTAQATQQASNTTTNSTATLTAKWDW